MHEGRLSGLVDGSLQPLLYRMTLGQAVSE